MRTQKIGEMVGVALERYEKLKVVEDVWFAEDVFADYLEYVEKNLNDEEWFYFDQIFEAMKKLRSAVPEFVDEAWESIMYEERKGKLHLFDNGYVGNKNDVEAQGTESLYSITLDWVDWVDSALANEDGSKDYSEQSAFKTELEEHLYELVLNDYFENWLEHIANMYARP